MFRNAVCSDSFFGRGVQRIVGFAAFFRAAHVGGGVGEWNPGFRQTDELNGLLRGDGEGQRLRISQANVLAREDNDAAGNEAKVFSGVQHFCQPVHRASSSEARMLLMKAEIVS